MGFEDLFTRSCPHCSASNPWMRVTCVECEKYILLKDERKYYGQYKEPKEDTEEGSGQSIPTS